MLNEEESRHVVCETCLLNPACDEACDLFPVDILERELLPIKWYKRILNAIRKNFGQRKQWMHQVTRNIVFSYRQADLRATININSTLAHIPEVENNKIIVEDLEGQDVFFFLDGAMDIWQKKKK